MRYLLDTNAIARYLNGRSLNVRARFDATPNADLAVSAVTVAELRFGAAKSRNPQQTQYLQDQVLNLIRMVSFDVACADAYGRVRADLERRGIPIGPNDMLIGSTALAHNLILVTHNTREFSRIPGLVIEDWEV